LLLPSQLYLLSRKSHFLGSCFPDSKMRICEDLRVKKRRQVAALQRRFALAVQSVVELIGIRRGGRLYNIRVHSPARRSLARRRVSIRG